MLLLHHQHRISPDCVRAWISFGPKGGAPIFVRMETVLIAVSLSNALHKSAYK